MFVLSAKLREHRRKLEMTQEEVANALGVAPQTVSKWERAETYPDITVYAPFKEDSKVATLDEPSTLVLKENLPVLDGALALYPVYAAFAQATYQEEAVLANPASVTFTDTVQAFRGLIAGERDIIITAAASKKQLEAAAEAGVELHLTEIGKEAFVFWWGKQIPSTAFPINRSKTCIRARL